MISISGLGKSIGSRILFEDASFNLNAGERYGLIGANGAGKSTFMRIMTGKESATLGQVQIPKNTSVGSLEQDQFINDAMPIIECAMSGDVRIFNAMKEKQKLLDSGDVDIHQLHDLEELIVMREGYTLESRAAEILEGLGIPAKLRKQNLSVLSGGYKLRVLLAQVLVSAPDVLLLDEPTNHLDIVTIRWLEKFLCQFSGCVVVISHDRRFLDRICTCMLDVDYETITHYVGNYTAFEQAKALVQTQREAEVAKAEAQIAHKQLFIDRFGAKATKARQAQSRMKQIEKIEIPEIKRTSRRYPSFQFTMKRPSGKEALKAKDISKSYAGKQVLKGLSVEIRRGDRLSIIGPNGVGKSTLLKILMSEVKADEGEYLWGHETYLGYFAQDHDSNFKKSDMTAEKWLWQFCGHESMGFVRSYLGRVLFTGDDAHKLLSQLSGGEKARLDLARLMIERPNVLILDEPTNHLDVEAIDALVASLKNYEGTLIFVSHDRWFVSELATRILEITPTHVQDYKGTFAEYLEHEGDDHLDAKTPVKIVKEPKQNYADQKAKQAQRRQIEKELERVTAELASKEERSKQIESIFCEADFFTRSSMQEIQKLQNEQKLLVDEQSKLLEKWEKLEQRLG